MANEKIRFDLTASDQTAAAFNAILGRLDSVDKSAQKTSVSAQMLVVLFLLRLLASPLVLLLFSLSN